MKVKTSSSKARYAAKNAPLFCEIWFVNKGKHIWTREAFEGPSFGGSISQSEIATADNLREQCSKSELMFDPECTRPSSSRSTESVPIEAVLPPSLPSSINRYDPKCYHNLSSLTNTSSGSGYTSFAEQRGSSDSATKDDDEESLHYLLMEAKIEAEASRDEAFQEISKRKKLEAEAVEAIGKVKY